MERMHRRFRLGLAGLLSAQLMLAIGCAGATPSGAPETPRMRSAAASAPDAGQQPASPVFATIEEAALAGLEATHAAAPASTRQTIRIGTIRAVAGGYTWQRPQLADAGLHATRPSVVRLRLLPEDVAAFVIHPASGDHRIDRANAVLSASEQRLLTGANGRARPVYLLTPRLEVVRHSALGESMRLAKLRGPRGYSAERGWTALEEGGRIGAAGLAQSGW